MPVKGSYGPCGSRPPLGESRHGLVGHVNHVSEGKSSCVSNGGLLLSVDRGLSLSDKTAISVADAFFSNIVCRFRHAKCDSLGSGTGVQE